MLNMNHIFEYITMYKYITRWRCFDALGSLVHQILR